MKIAILGAGAMGSLYGAYLSRKNEVWLLDTNKEKVNEINHSGITVTEADGTEHLFSPHATADPHYVGKADLVIVFVKAMFTEDALEANKDIIGDETYLMTLQNGAGHEKKLLRYSDKSHVIIGSTQHNSSLVSPGHIKHGGSGMTMIGLLSGDKSAISPIAKTFTECGLECIISESIQYQIWHKLFTNTAASSLTAIFQVPLGRIVSDPLLNGKMRALAGEAVFVANALGLPFKRDEVIKEIEEVCTKAPDGYTSIYWDIKNGRKTEVDTISGAVLTTARELGIPVPEHEWVVEKIHEMERKGREVK